MKIPLAAHINCLNGYSVCYFKDKNYKEEVPAHYYITIPTKTKNYLILCMISSKWEKKLNYYEKVNKKCLSSLIFVEKSELNFLTKRSVIDCNAVEHFSKDSLKNRIDSGSYKFVTESISDGLKIKIINAINSSPQVKPFIKEDLFFKVLTKMHDLAQKS